MLAIPKGDKYNSTLVASVWVPHVQINLCSGIRRKTLKYGTVHVDNARGRISRRSREVLRATGVIRVPDFAYSPDRKLCDSYFFGNLKEKLQSVALRDGNSIISVILEIFRNTRPDALIMVDQNWMKRLCRGAKNGGQCCKNCNKNPDSLNLRKFCIDYSTFWNALSLACACLVGPSFFRR
jgi:hypothetical protein